MATNLLTDAVLRALKSSDKVQRHTDGDGLSLIIKPNGSKLWRYRFNFHGLEKNKSLGSYPTVTLAAARKKRDACKVDLSNKINPADERRKRLASQVHTVESVGREWLEKVSGEITAGTLRNRTYRFNHYIVPMLGKYPVNTVTAQDIYDLLKKVQKTGKISTMHNVKKELVRIFQHAVITKGLAANPATGLTGAVQKENRENHFPAVLVPWSFGKLLNDLDTYSGHAHVKILARLFPHVMLRPSEVRCGEWSEVDFPSAQWRIPKARMKKNRDHIVPLSRQALALLEELHEITGDGRLMFPSAKDPSQSVCHSTVNKGLYRLGYRGKQTQHGFRACASTLLNEAEVDADAIELQLAHTMGGTRGAYWRTLQINPKLALRAKMMQAWSDEIDRLKASALPPQREKPKLRLVA